MIEFQDQKDLIACYDWDSFNGDDDVFIGSIKRNKDDNYYWFHPARNRIPLSCRQLKELMNKISELNIEGVSLCT